MIIGITNGYIPIWNNKGIGIAPCNNLVKNIGFDTDATIIQINRPKMVRWCINRRNNQKNNTPIQN